MAGGDRGRRQCSTWRRRRAPSPARPAPTTTSSSTSFEEEAEKLSFTDEAFLLVGYFASSSISSEFLVDCMVTGGGRDRGRRQCSTWCRHTAPSPARPAPLRPPPPDR